MRVLIRHLMQPVEAEASVRGAIGPAGCWRGRSSPVSLVGVAQLLISRASVVHHWVAF